MFYGCLICRIYFFRIMSPSSQTFELFICVVFDKLLKPRVSAEKMFSNISTGLYNIFLIITIYCPLHSVYQNIVFVRGKKRIPIIPPDDLYNIPSRPSEYCFKLLYNLAVSPHRAVQTLQVAVNYKNEIIQLFS